MQLSNALSTMSRAERGSPSMEGGVAFVFSFKPESGMDARRLQYSIQEQRFYKCFITKWNSHL